MNNFIDIMQERGFLHQCTDKTGLAKQLEQPSVGYIGFDCTAPSLHVGSLLPLMMLHWFQQCGHQPIVVMGGGTSMVGDPSGKDTTRKILSKQDIETNKSSLEKIFERFIKFREPRRLASLALSDKEIVSLSLNLERGFSVSSRAMLLDNAGWLGALEFIDFLRKVGPHFSINRMLSMDSVKNRISRQQEMSLLEFNYMVLQAFDFVHLAQNTDCVLQMGGSDQWGNIVNGIDLGRRMGTQQLFGLTCPLIQTASGDKMGKTASGAVWLNPDLTSPFDFWQFWRNTDDRDVERFLKLFTTLDLVDINATMLLPDINMAKKLLADAVTEFVHGDLKNLFVDFTPNGTPIPATRRFSIADLGPNATTATIAVLLGMFPSLTQARKNGFNSPLTAGSRHEFTKKKIVVEIVE